MRPKSPIRITMESLEPKQTFTQLRTEISEYWRAQSIAFCVGRDMGRKFTVRYDKQTDVLTVERTA